MTDTYMMHEEHVEAPLTGTLHVDASPVEKAVWPETAKTVNPGVNGLLPWLKEEEIHELQAHWALIQAKFVDEPHTSVEQADALVGDALGRIEQVYTHKRTMLNEQWMNKADISTEDLRVVLKSYREFLNRLLTL